MDRHSLAVSAVAADIRRFYELGESYRVFHGSSNSTRPRHGTRQNIVDISNFSNVVVVGPERRIALMEPNVPMDRLVEKTMTCNLVPPVVMEFPGITAGGGFSGTSGESSSFRHGFFNNTVNSVEMILGNGDIVQASRQEREDLFHGAAGAARTLGIVTLIELRLVEARNFVKTTYRKFQGIPQTISEIQTQTQNRDIDYLDGIVFSPEHSVIISGELVDGKPTECKVQTFSDPSDPWFYMHVKDKTQSLSQWFEIVEYIPLGEYLFRYDRAAFWVGRQGYTYFQVVPFTKFFRWLLDDYSHTRTLYHALHASGVSSQFVVQDLALPYDTVETFMNWVDGELGIWPLWLCPLQGCAQPTFHPVTESKGKAEMGEKEKPCGPGQMSQPMINVGVWGWGPQDYATFLAKNRELENNLVELGGRKWLYAHTYYTEEEFWAQYDRPWYQALREKYFATILPTIYDKVKVQVRAEWKAPKQWARSGSAHGQLGGYTV